MLSDRTFADSKDDDLLRLADLVRRAIETPDPAGRPGRPPCARHAAPGARQRAPRPRAKLPLRGTNYPTPTVTAWC
jgi:hypothetical protein